MHSCANGPARSSGLRLSSSSEAARLDLVTGVAACTAAGDLLDDGPGAGGQLSPVVLDPVLAVLDEDGDDLPRWVWPRWIFVPATMRLPWLETTRLTRVMPAGGAVGGGPVRRAPCRRRPAGGRRAPTWPRASSSPCDETDKTRNPAKGTVRRCDRPGSGEGRHGGSRDRHDSRPS
jgi:hypothetical protein